MPKREKTIEALYRLHYDDLLRRACILLHDEEDARDAVSDVMARLMAADGMMHHRSNGVLFLSIERVPSSWLKTCR